MSLNNKIIKLARREYRARNNEGQGRLARIEMNIMNIKNGKTNAQKAHINRLRAVAYRGIESENARRQARRKSPSRSARVNSAARKAAVRLRKPIMNRRIAATIHQLRNILPRNVLEKIIKNSKRISPARR
jgi:hypothetical protein